MNTPLNLIELRAMTVPNRIFLAPPRLWQANADAVSALLSAKCCTRRAGFNFSGTKTMIDGGSALWTEPGSGSAAEIDRRFGAV